MAGPSSNRDHGAVPTSQAEQSLPRSRVVVITHEPIGENLSGPGIRAIEIGRVLAERHSVTIATPFPPAVSLGTCTLEQYSFDRPESLTAIAKGAAVLVVQGLTLSRFPLLAGLGVPIAADLYCPFTLEHLEMVTSAPGADAPAAAGTGTIDDDVDGILAAQNAQLALADFFICASERQRDFWIGALHTAGRINLLTYAHDRTLRTLIDVVPFGLPNEPFEPADGNVLKGVWPGIRKRDYLLLWGGSLLDWQDPQTLVRAVAAISRRRSDVKLFFMGTRHPNPQVAPMRVVGETIALAQELGVLNTSVFFNDWVPYEDRSRYLAEADLGVSTHHDHLETRLSFRTRMLDYLWAGLPIVCTDGDVFASLVRERGLGVVVPPGDAEGLAAMTERLLDDPTERERCRSRSLEAAREFQWSRVAVPLARYCEAPWFAADRTPAPDTGRWLGLSYRLTNWVRRAAVAAGVPSSRIEQARRFKPIRDVMSWRNRLLLARAREDMTKREPRPAEKRTH
jgi:glycosyltransferase involved in cell wall biosynthesis